MTFGRSGLPKTLFCKTSLFLSAGGKFAGGRANSDAVGFSGDDLGGTEDHHREIQVGRVGDHDIADLVLQVLSFVAQNERENIKKRQEEGIKAAKLRGVIFGRPVIVPPDDFGNIIRRWESGQVSAQDAARLSDMSIATFYRRLREFRKKQKSLSKGTHFDSVIFLQILRFKGLKSLEFT